MPEALVARNDVILRLPQGFPIHDDDKAHLPTHNVTAARRDKKRPRSLALLTPLVVIAVLSYFSAFSSSDEP